MFNLTLNDLHFSVCETCIPFCGLPACKIVAAELEDQLQKTGKSHDVIQTGYHLDADPKSKTTTKYRKS